MADQANIEPNGIESKVPGEQEIRRGSSEQENEDSLIQEDNAIATKDDFSLSPVITVTKNEATFTKGDMKLQKVTVTEDVSNDASIITDTRSDIDNHYPTSDENTEILELPSPAETDSMELENAVNSETGEEVPEVKKISKIPRLRFRAAINKIREQRDQKNKNDVINMNKRRSSIPRLKGSKVLPQPDKEKETKEESIGLEELITEITEAEFDKIYDEIVDHADPDVSINCTPIDDPEKVEINFEEIIHAYDENQTQPIQVEKVRSRIPLLKRKSEQEIEFKPFIRELPRKGSVGKIPIPTSLREKYQTLETEIIQNKSNASDTSNIKIENTNDDTSKNDTDLICQVTDDNYVSKTVHKSQEISKGDMGSKIPIINKNHTNIPPTVLQNNRIRLDPNKSNVMIESKIQTMRPKTSVHILKDDKYHENEVAVPSMLSKNAERSTSDNHIEFESEDSPISKQEINENNITSELVPSNSEPKQEINENNITSESKLDSEMESTVTESEFDVYINQNDEFNLVDWKDHNSIIKEQDKTLIDDTNEIDVMNSKPIPESDLDTNYKNKPVKSNEGYAFESTLIDNNNVNDTEDIKIDDYSFKNAYKGEENAAIATHKTSYLSRAFSREKSEDNENTTLHHHDSFKHEPYVNPERVNSPHIQESEVIIKYKPDVKEVEMTKQKYVLENIDNPMLVNARYKSKDYNLPILSQVERQPVKYKSIKATQTVDERNEEDIIILKGKVNRVISRLDSIEPKINKKVLDDIPNHSVKSKISLFESNDHKAFMPKSLIFPKEDKPRVVEVLLKEKNGKKSNEMKFFSNVDDILSDDKVKVAYWLKDELAQYEKNNIRPVHSKLDEKKNEESTQDTNDHNLVEDNNESKLTTNPNDDDDVFSKKSAEIINAYKLNQQKKNINVDLDMKRAKSLAELDLGDAVNGKVKKMIHRMKSVDKIEWRKEVIDSREKPRKGSVFERIALFEGRVPPTKPEVEKTTPHPMADTEPVETQEHLDRIAELVSARVKYGSFGDMRHVEVGTAEVPALWVGTAGLEPGVARHVVRAAIELGYRAFDTAFVYGTEREVGEAINEKIADGTVRREELFISSKLWSTFHRTDLVEAACRRSLETMGLDYFDLFMIHNPMSFKEGPDTIPMIANVIQYSEHDYLDAWFGIEDVVKKGLARRAGVSNFNTKQIQRILDKGKLKPVVNQVESHPYLNQLALENFCEAHNMKLSVFGALGSKGTPAEWKSGLSPVIDDPLVKLMAAGLEITPAQLLISYQLSLGRMVVVKTSSAERLWGNLQALSIRLQPEHISALHSLNKNRRTFTFKGMGDTHKNYPFSEL